MTDEERSITSGGGIVRGSQRSARGDTPQTPSDLTRAFRRRWATGIAVMTLRDGGRLRGITLTAMMPLSLEPPLVAVGLTAGGEFPSLAKEGRRCVIAILVRDQEFLSERFAGRAPVPDAAFTGVPHELDAHGVPILSGAAAHVTGGIVSRAAHGDHELVVIEVDGGEIGPDEDDPLLTYEGAYRGLEVE
ncbi:MAG TPA: flavin reductase family protein [Thermomicrobiales bacterium]|nr:flavin reductase family protein [Thermomicrobiales bacterium]